MARRKKKTRRRRSKPLIKVMPALEAYAIANVATQNLMGGNPFQVLLGDLNAQAGTGVMGTLMGPQPGVLTLKELLTGEYNVAQLQGMTGASSYLSPTSGSSSTFGMQTGVISAGTPLEVVTENFKNNFGNIVVGSVFTTAGFRIASKVLAKPKNKANAMLRQVGLGGTIQF